MAGPIRPPSGSWTSNLLTPWRHRGIVRALLAISLALIAGVPAAQELESQAPAPFGAVGLAYWYSWAAMLLVCAAMAVAYGRMLRPFGRYMLGHLGQALILVALLLLVWGVLGVGFGVPNLIWDEAPLGRSASALGATLLLALLGANAFYLEVSPREGRRSPVLDEMHAFLRLHGLNLPFGAWLDPSPHGRRPDEVSRRGLSVFLRASRLPFLVLISLPALFPRPFSYVPWHAPAGDAFLPGWLREGSVRDDWRAYLFGLATWGAGLFLGIIVVKLLLRVSSVLSNFVAWLAEPEVASSAGQGLRGRTLRAAAVAARWMREGGFHQYLLIVCAIYLYLALSSSELPWAWAAALVVLLGASLPQLFVSHLLRDRGRATDEDVRVSWAVCLLVLLCGAMALAPRILAVGTIAPAFAIFALLGLLATAHVVYERRDVRPVYFVFGCVLAFLLGLPVFRWWAGEPVTPHDVLAVAALLPVFAFGLVQLRVPDPARRSERLPLRLLAGALALFVAILPLALLAGGGWDPPVIALAALSCLLGCVAVGSIHGHRHTADRGGYERRRWILLTAAAASWILLVNYDPFKDRFDRLSYGGRADRLGPLIEKVYPYNILKLSPPAKLLENYEVLQNWKKLAAGRRAGKPDGKPKLVVVCVSGGAIRSAYWAATVLERLEAEPGLDDFHDHVRLITGASGGMVGTAYYVAARHADLAAGREPGRFRAGAVRIPSKSLNPVAAFIALQSPWRMLLPRLPGAAADDRGRVLERDWRDVEDVAFAALRPFEAQGKIPSLIFSPMIVDDGRRLLITNLDLTTHKRSDRPEPGGEADRRERLLKEWPVPSARQDDLDNDNNGSYRNQFSISALELFKIVPDAEGLTLATAARMSATFPFVSPAVNLPTNPPLRVVDAGYYDNYGVHLANAWILQNRRWLFENTSGILVVQTRDSVSKRDRLGVPSEAGGFLGRFLQGAQLFASVSDALLRARYSTNTFRNDQESIAVNEVFRGMGARDDFVATAVFENTAYLSTNAARPESGPPAPAARWPGLHGVEINAVAGEVPMSWYLTDSERRAITSAIPDPPGAQDYTLILRKYRDHQEFFHDCGDYKPLRKALSFASLFAESQRFQDPNDFDKARAARLHERFVLLGAMLARLSNIQTGGKLDGAEDVERLGRRLAEWSSSPDAGALAERFFKPGSRPAKAEVDRESGRIGEAVAAAIDDRDTDRLSEKQVLLYAHTELLNGLAGFDPDAQVDKPACDSLEPQSPLLRAYYTREFERVMNYHRLEAVRWWWGDGHEPAGDE